MAKVATKRSKPKAKAKKAPRRRDVLPNAIQTQADILEQAGK